MKKSTLLTLALALSAGLSGSLAQAAPLAVGDAIKLDFSTAGDAAGGSLADWNQVSSGATLSSVKRHGAGTTIDGVSIAFTNLVAGNFNDDGTSNNWGGTAADPYYIPAADDIYFHGNGNDLSVTFGGLDPMLNYVIRIYSLIDRQSTTDTFVVTDGAGFQTVTNTRNFRWNAASLEASNMVFSDLQLNANNQLVVRVQDVGSVFYPLNAIVVQAVSNRVPEPSSLAVVAAALMSLVAVRRRQR